ncbi:hypothetical protein B0J14DRAFT_655960 [Halenospora varia]|nr:hypothetical protein B0J14DRAFT_655960 [Halenospora varia]
MWHPQFTEERSDTAGLFVHFRKTLLVEEVPAKPLTIQITADTRCKLYINSRMIAVGLVKGDQHLWFYDEIDLAPFLMLGRNQIGVHVLRFFHAIDHASSFPRLPTGGLMVRAVRCDEFWKAQIQSSSSWETAIDSFAILPTNLPEDDFLHIYENHGRIGPQQLKWVPARVHEFQDSTAQFSAVHNISSPLEQTTWEETLIRIQDDASKSHQSLLLPAQGKHYLELEVEHHMTALLRFRFRRPSSEGSILAVIYAESYEDPPHLVPYLRSKGNRHDDSKALYDPQDKYSFRVAENVSGLGYYEDEDTQEIFMPFHFRTFRFIGLQFDVGASDLVLEGIEITMVN